MFKQIISDLEEFLKYLSSAWGLLSIFTPLFPLFNNFSELMPPPKVYSDFFTLLATLCGVFAVFYNFTHRDTQEDTSALKLFFIAIATVMTYLIILPALPTTSIEQQLGITTIPPFVNLIINLLRAIWSAAEPMLYIMVFYLFTYAFAVSAVREWQRRY